MKPWISFGCALTFLLASSVTATPIPGFVEHFSVAGNVAGWGGGASVSNPGTGGALGDGYLRISRVGFAGSLGARSIGTSYAGDWIAAGVAGVELQLRDVDAVQDLQIHVAIGNAENFWQYNPAFVPPVDSWGVFVVDLTDSSNFTHIINFSGGGFAKALREADRLLVRHDRAPFSQNGDAILGEFGVDEIRLMATPPVDAKPSTWGKLRALYR